MSDRGYTVCKYGAEAEMTHPHNGIANYNESEVFIFLDPVSQVGGTLRIGNRPTLGYTEVSVQLTLPVGVLAFRAGREPGERNDGFDSMGLRFQIAEPTRSFKIDYANDLSLVSRPSLLAERARIALKNAPAQTCGLSLTFDASAPMFEAITSADGDCTPGSSTIASDHYEQFGRMSGTISLGERAWTIKDASAFRDHSWGPREWASYDGEWLCAWLADGTCITAYGEFEPSGVRIAGGVVTTPDAVNHPISRFDVYDEYFGAESYGGRFSSVIETGDLPILVLDGAIRHFVPLTQKTEDRAVRMARMTVDFAGGHGGWAIAEFLRPIRRS